MNTEDLQLILDYLHGRESVDAKRLNAILRGDADARAYLRLSAAVEIQLRELALVQADHPRKELRTAPWRAPLALAASLALIATIAWQLWPSESLAPIQATRLISTVNARWDSDATELSLNAGDAPAGLLRLVEGAAEFVTAHGATVTLKGQTVMRFEDAKTLFIESGKVLCRCPTPESRVTVCTPQTKVVDLGTEFAVEARGDSSTRVAVLSGEVRVGEAAEARVLHQGEAAEVRSHGVTLLRTEVLQEMMPSPSNSFSLAAANKLRNSDFAFASSDAWRLIDARVQLTNGALHISSQGHRYWPNARQAIWQSDIAGRVVTASVLAMQPSEDPLQAMQFAVLKINFIGESGRTLAYASRHFQFGGDAPNVFQRATISAAAPLGTKGLSYELLLNARGEEHGTVIFDDAVLTVEP